MEAARRGRRSGGSDCLDLRSRLLSSCAVFLVVFQYRMLTLYSPTLGLQLRLHATPSLSFHAGSFVLRVVLLDTEL